MALIAWLCAWLDPPALDPTKWEHDSIGRHVVKVGPVTHVTGLKGTEDIHIVITDDEGKSWSCYVRSLAYSRYLREWWEKREDREQVYARVRVYDWGGGWYPDNRIGGVFTLTSEFHIETGLQHP